MSREENITLPYRVASMLWMILSHRHDSLRFNQLFPLVREALSLYSSKLYLLDRKNHCIHIQELGEKGILKERYWKFGIFMAAATTLPLLYKTAAHQDMAEAVCAKASVSTSAKLLDNLNDEVQTYEEALHSLSAYRSALGKGVYVADKSDTGLAEHSAHEIATWAYKTISSRIGTDVFSEDVDLLVSGQIASLTHKKGKYPSIREYLSKICERSIGNVWIDVDLTFLEKEDSSIKEGNDYIFKSYLIYDDVQDIARDLRSNSINAAVILGLERGILTEREIKGNPVEIIEKLEKSGIFQDLLWLGDLTFLRGLEIISECSCNPVDREGFKASLGLIRMFNMRRTLKREKNFSILGAFLAGHRRLKKVRRCAPEYIHEMVEYV